MQMRQEHFGVLFIVAGVLLLLLLLACRPPGTPIPEPGSPAIADKLGVSLSGAAVYVVRDVRRNATCWITINSSGGSVAMACLRDELPSAPPIVSAPVPAATAAPVEPVLSPVPK